MVSNYYLLFKTAQAEFRAWDNLYEDAKKTVKPIIELTRGRKKPRSEKNWEGTNEDLNKDLWPITEGIFEFYSSVEKTVQSFKECDEVVIDLTREETLTCYEINEISKSHNGYVAWLNFLSGLKNQGLNLIPTLIINPDDNEDSETYIRNIQTQFQNLASSYNCIVYRTAILVDPDFIYDLTLLKDHINSYTENGNKFKVVLDHEYIRNGMGILHALRTKKIIEDIHLLLPKAEIVILSTSFPSTVTEPSHDSFPIEEQYLYEELKGLVSNDITLEYGDYGSINPVRNDVTGARGWVPRIDYPTDMNRTICYREKRNKIGEKINPKSGKKSPIFDEYGPHYVSIAENMAFDSDFKEIENSWGTKQILETSEGRISGKAPSFWISVRMEIHILQQLARLNLL